jgi:hypothetical protein
MMACEGEVFFTVKDKVAVGSASLIEAMSLTTTMPRVSSDKMPMPPDKVPMGLACAVFAALPLSASAVSPASVSPAATSSAAAFRPEASAPPLGRICHRHRRGGYGKNQRGRQQNGGHTLLQIQNHSFCIFKLLCTHFLSLCEQTPAIIYRYIAARFYCFPQTKISVFPQILFFFFSTAINIPCFAANKHFRKMFLLGIIYVKIQISGRREEDTMHDLSHEHSNGHEHGHEHGHSHDSVSAAAGPTDKTRLIMDFTLEHNRQHAAEMRALAEKLRAEGKAAAAGLLAEGVNDYERGNEKIARAIEHLI